MQTRTKQVLIGILVVLIIVGGVSYLSFRSYVKGNIDLLSEGLELIQAGEYEAGLAKCNQIDYSTGICYISVVGSKARNNETVTEEDCDRIPTEDGPFWDLKENYKERMLESKEECREIAISS